MVRFLHDALFSVDQYRLFRRDRQHGRGGEVATCTCSSFPGAGENLT